MGNSNCLWPEIEQLDDELITYLLYKEGKSLELIGRIRNLPIDKIRKQLVNAKAKNKSKNQINKVINKSLLDYLLGMSKEDRINVINNLSKEEKLKVAREIYKKYRWTRNFDDKLTIIWIMGELKDENLLPILYGELKNPSVNMRRVSCSAISKYKLHKTKDYLIQLLKDTNPQVRQYAAKGLGHIGDEKVLAILKEKLENTNEKIYVKRALTDSIEQINNNYDNKKYVEK